MQMCQVSTKAFMKSAVKWHAQKIYIYNLKINVEDTKFSNFFLTNVDVPSRYYNIITFTCFSCD